MVSELIKYIGITLKTNNGNLSSQWVILLLQPELVTPQLSMETIWLYLVERMKIMIN